MTMRIARVFPRRTNASPTDALAFFDAPGMFPVEADEVHVSVAFTWDIPRAERLTKAWERIAPVIIGGPALGAAEKRLRATLALGVLPMAMLWRNGDDPPDREWLQFRRPWMRAAITRMEGFIHV